MTQINRRDMLKQTAFASALYLTTSSPVRAHSVNSKLNLAFIGVGGRGNANLRTIN